MTNYRNSNLPHVYYGEYDGNKFLSCHVSNPNIITREEYDVLGYIEYKYMTKDELMTEEQIRAAAKKIQDYSVIGMVILPQKMPSSQEQSGLMQVSHLHG